MLNTVNFSDNLIIQRSAKIVNNFINKLIIMKEVRNMPIKMSLLELGKKQVDLIDELRKRGYSTIQPAELSAFINKKITTPKAKTVLAICDEIIEDWKSKSDKEENN